MVSVTSNLFIGNVDGILQQSHPQINLGRDMSLIIGTYYVCHEEEVDAPLSTEAILQHIFVTSGGCPFCIEHLSKTKNSVSRIYQMA
jgi:hypothetical protein